MRKTLIWLLIAIMVCTMMPMTAFAEQVADLPEAWQKPTNVVITNETEGYGEFVLMVSYTVGSDHSTFVDDLEYQENYGKYGLSEPAYHSSQMQIDWRIDGGSWHYDPIWDTANEDRTGADAYLYYRSYAPYGNERAGSDYILRLPARDDWDANSEGWQDAMRAQGAGDLTANSEGYMQLDLTKHKVEVRVRLITQVVGEDIDAVYGEDNAYHYILSPWSDIAAIGKGVGAVTRPTSLPVPTVTNFSVDEAENNGVVPDGYPIFTYNLTVPADVEELASRATALWAGFKGQVQVKMGNGEWQNIMNDGGWDHIEITSGQHTGYMPALTQGDYAAVLGGECQMRVRYHWFDDNDPDLYSQWSQPLTFGSAAWTASAWAVPELKKADEMGIIPEVLKNADLKQDITRAEFAAVCVKAYENLSGTAAIPIVNNPFTDCNDVEVLKAYNIGAVNGTSATTFAPNALLNREQAATMLTRVFKKVTLAGWTLTEDSKFTLDYVKPAPFADDSKISGYAKDSVYFMAANGIVGGVGNNMFAPKNTTSKETAEGYANATREQALLIAVRMVENLK